MKTITIHLTDITASDNQLKISIPENLGAVKTIDAVLNTNVSLNSTDSFKVNFSALDSNESVVKSWENVDYIKDISSGKISIDISDEFQTAIDCECPYIVLNFVGTSTISFSGSDLKIDYTSLSEFQANGSSHNIDLGKSGKASIDLATGKLSVSTPIVLTDSKTLPLSISANYHSVKNDKIPNTGMPDNWHLNVSQFLIKEETPDGSLLFTYVDENGKNQIIEEKYYYIDDSNKKVYISRSDLTVDLDGNYKYENFDIKTELKAPSGLKLVSSISDIPGSHLVDYEPEELIQIKENVNQYSNAISDLENNIENYQKQFCIYALTKKAIEQQLNMQETSIANNKTQLELQKQLEIIRKKTSENNRYFRVGTRDKNDGITLTTSGDSTTVTSDSTEYNVDNELAVAAFGSVPISQSIIDSLVDANFASDENKVKGSIVSTESSFIISLGFNSDYSDGSLAIQKKSLEDNETFYTQVIELSNFETIINNTWKLYTKDACEFKTDKLLACFKNNVDESTNKITFGYKDLISTNYQLQQIVQGLNKYNKQLNEYKDKLAKLKHQQKIYELQVPVHYLYNDSNVIYGFGKTLDDEDIETNLYRLILITDAYENTIFISYDSLTSNRISNIVDSSDKTISFSYDKDTNYLKTVTDARDRKTSFVICDNLISGIDNNGQHTLFSYKNELLQGILNPSGNGIKITYDGKQVVKVQAVSVVESITHNCPVYKSNYKDDKTTFIDCVVDDSVVNFTYNNYKSTSITNSKNKKVTYLFDKYGKVHCVYENSYTGDLENFNPEEFSTNVNDYNYSDENISIKTTALQCSTNYLEDEHFNSAAVIEKAYISLGNLMCGDDCVPYNYPVYSNYHSMQSTNTAENVTSISLKSETIDSINSIECFHKTLILSGWAKADSACITDDTADYPAYLTNRKFELRAEISYDDNSIDIFKQSFDWRNTDWQYCALPINLKSTTITKIECFVDYSNNTGAIYFTDLELKEGDYEKTEYNSDRLPIMKSTGHSEWETYYTYDEDQKLTSETIKSKNTQTEYITTYEYNKNGKIIKTIDYNGIVKESIYNEKGAVIKTLTYHKEEPANILYEETILDNKGNSTYDVNEFGEKVVDYNYIDGTGITASTVDTKGIKTSYGYDHNDTLIQTTTTINGEENTNIYGYTLDLLTSLTHNEFSIKYSYDKKGRKTNITIADNEYLNKTYNDNEEVTTLATGESFKQLFDNNGNVLETYYKANEASEYVLMSQNIYDIYGNLVYCKDLTDNSENIHSYDFDNFGHVVSETNSQHGASVSINSEYDENHTNIDHSTIKIGNTVMEYDYGYSISPDAKLERITSDLGDETITYDKLGRIKKLDSSVLKKEFNYLKVGDHTSTLVSKINFATNGNISDNLSYKYDEKGNIVEVRQNNELIARYKYDSLSRIVREDNKTFETTTTYEYDAGGNITCKKVYNFTLVDNLAFEKEPQVVPYVYPIQGWRDQLKEFNGEKFEYDTIGNPTTYRGKNLEWSHGRQLDKFADIAEFTYNTNGIRTSKIANGYTTSYYVNGNKIIRQHDALNTLDFYYGADGISGFHILSINNAGSIILDNNYFFKKNMQNDVVGLIDNNGNQIARYSYDAWGKQKIEYLDTNGNFVDIPSEYMYNDTSSINCFVACKNPFRYRSYYYDLETGLYYLSSRYYDPEIGRFINADEINAIDVTKITTNGLNLYCYCLNNPVNEVDENGYFLSWLFGLLIAAIVFAVANTAIQVVSTVIQGLATGNWDWGFEKFAGAFIGGFFGGLAFVLSGFNTQIAFGVMSFTETLSTNLLTNATGKTTYSFASILFKSAALGGIGYFFGKGFTKLQGVTKGINSFIAVFKSGITKLFNGTVSKMSLNVFMKGIFGTFVLKSAGITSGIMKSLGKWISYLFGNEEAIGYDL